jgi:hypothetical protein
MREYVNKQTSLKRDNNKKEREREKKEKEKKKENRSELNYH